MVFTEFKTITASSMRTKSQNNKSYKIFINHEINKKS